MRLSKAMVARLCSAGAGAAAAASVALLVVRQAGVWLPADVHVLVGTGGGALAFVALAERRALRGPERRPALWLNVLAVAVCLACAAAGVAFWAMDVLRLR